MTFPEAIDTLSAIVATASLFFAIIDYRTSRARNSAASTADDIVETDTPAGRPPSCCTTLELPPTIDNADVGSE